MAEEEEESIAVTGIQPTGDAATPQQRRRHSLDPRPRLNPRRPRLQHQLRRARRTKCSARLLVPVYDASGARPLPPVLRPAASPVRSHVVVLEQRRWLRRSRAGRDRGAGCGLRSDRPLQEILVPRRSARVCTEYPFVWLFLADA